MSYATIAATPYQPPAPALPAPSSGTTESGSGPTLWSHGGFSFKDLLDIVNPLQHLPVIGSIYRYLTGDEPSGGARIVGDSLYGGPIGFGVSVVSTAFLTDSSGRDVGEQLLADVFGPRGSSPTLGTPVVAAAQGVSGGANPASPSQTALVATPAQPVAMDQLFRSPPAMAAANPPRPAVAAANPQQSFLARNAQLERQISNGRGANGAVINHQPIPLELSSGLLPIAPGVRYPAPLGNSQAPASATSQASALPSSGATTETNPIARKMLDALNKYEQLKRQEEQQDRSGLTASPKVDLAL